MITFMTTLYNEEKEIFSLLSHISDYVDFLVLVNDGSTDDTWRELQKAVAFNDIAAKTWYQPIEHTGSCEQGRLEAIKHVPAGSWVIMLDADERFESGVLPKIVEYIHKREEDPSFDSNITHIYFTQKEYIDGVQTRTFEKPKVFKKESIHLPDVIHGDPGFEGDPISFQWVVLHRKSSDKQRTREAEYIKEYQRLLDEGKIDEGKKQWFENMHYFVRDDTIPHG